MDFGFAFTGGEVSPRHLARFAFGGGRVPDWLRLIEPPPKSREIWAQALNRVATFQDRTAFAALFEHFAPRVKSFLLRRGLAEARAEEVTQEAMLSVWRKAALYDPHSAGVSTWIFAIARNLHIDARRRDARSVAEDLDAIERDFEIDPGPRADDAIVVAEREREVHAALEQLPEEQRRVVRLSFFDEAPHSEIAKTLGIPLGTVKSRLRLAVGRLKDLLDEAWP